MNKLPLAASRTVNLLGGATLIAMLTHSQAFAHGLVESPPSRQQFCGVLTKPHETSNADALYPECADAFEGYVSGGYSYMSVLTHARGRLRPLPELSAGETAPDNEADGSVPDLAENVCGYDAETFDYGTTPWDTPIDWPTTAINSGRNLFLWNIQWGPHFDDTQEFHYWITKEDFQFEVGKALTWDDFEEQPFCQLDFDRDDYDANPDIVADTDNAKFYTYCDVPERSGQHVIYAEWGRNYFTWERFHGCIDVEFDGSGETTLQASISASPTGDLTGAGSIQLSASNSSGDDLSYQWSIKEQTTDATYSFSSSSAETTSLSYSDVSEAGQLTIYLTVTSGEQSATQSLTLDHQPEVETSQWDYLQALTESVTLSSGDTVQMRVVLESGEDVYLPAQALQLTDETAGAAAWPLALANAVNELDSYIVIGVLDTSSDSVEAVSSATANNVYAQSSAEIASVFLNIEESSDGSETEDPETGDGETETPVDPEEDVNSDVQCYYQVNSQWSGGFSAKVVIENNSDEDVSGWELSWSYSDGSYITHSWNANLSDSYTASNLSWNATVAAGNSIEFGFNGVSASSAAEVPEVTGDICSTTSSDNDSSADAGSEESNTDDTADDGSSDEESNTDDATDDGPSDEDTNTDGSTDDGSEQEGDTSESEDTPDNDENSGSSESESEESETDVTATILISEDFEDKTLGQVPSGWGTNVSYVQSEADSSDALQHSDKFKVVEGIAYSGTKSVYVSGVDQTKRYLFKDIEGLSEEKMYIRLYVRSAQYLGNRSDESMNHNHFLAVSNADPYNEQEIRIGEMKGAIGVNDSVSDDLYPKYEQWWGKSDTTQMQADTWYCVESSFDNTGDYSAQKIWINDELIADIDNPDDFNNGAISDKWLTDRFSRINIGWASWNTYANNLYFDDIVVSTERIGCLQCIGCLQLQFNHKRYKPLVCIFPTFQVAAKGFFHV